MANAPPGPRVPRHRPPARYAPEYTTVYLSPDGKLFRVRRLACTMYGRQFMTARDVSLAVANPASLSEDGDDDGLEIYEEGKLWEGC